MADAESNIIINVDTSIGIAEIKNLQRQISELNAQLLQSGAQQARAAQNIQRNLINNINATGKFAANVKTISSTAESFTTSLERNKLSMGEYFRYAGASTQTFGRLFKNEFNTIQKVAESRVKTLQTQFIKLGRDGSGALKAIAVRPLALDMENLSTKTAIAAQKQQLFNQLVKQGSTNLLNFGKNTQWAGRQLMVGFTIPLAMMGAQAAKTFMQMEEQAIRFKRVYGDTFTATEETDKMIKQVKELASEFTKYGVQVEKTMEMAADAAAMGLQSADLLAQIKQATTLAVLGGVEQEQALETTISLMNSFGTTAKDLAADINFLNAVENQTVTAIEDLTIAIPKAAPVIKQLGGDVQDLAFFLTAMKEGGINASEGANALKSGLASLINPTGKAAEFLAQMGINLKGIVEANAGDVKGTVIGFAQALDTLDPLSRARAIEQLFGKFQFARLSTLFQNVIQEGTQAQRVLQLTRSSSEELAILAERELKRVEDSPMYKFKKAVEDIKVSLVPLGEAFLKAITPVIEFAKQFLDRFNSMSEEAKNFAVIATTVVAGIGPVLLMTFGLVANGVANLIKMFAAISNIFRGAGKSSVDLGTSTEYMTQQQLEAAAVAASLDQSHSKLIQTFNVEAASVNKLAAAYGRAAVSQSRLLGQPLGAGAGRGAAKAPLKLSNGIVSVPGPKGAGDVVPAMLSPGEAVIPARQSKKYSGLIQGMMSDSIPGFRFGRLGAAASSRFNPFAMMLGRSRVAVRTKQEDLMTMLKSGKDARYASAFETGTGADYLSSAGLPNPRQQMMRSKMEEKMFGLGADTPASARPTYGYARTSPMQALINKLFGFRGKQYNAVTAGGMIGSPTDTLKRYGNIDLITKRSVGRRSQAAVTDALMDYNRMGASFRLAPVSMRGKGDFDRARFDRLSNPFGTYKSDPINNPNVYSSNPKPPYVETYTPGGFSLNEVSKIRVVSRSEARQLQKLVDQAGLKIKVTPQNAPTLVKAFANIFGTRFEQGTVSFGGKNFNVASQLGAQSIYKTIAMLQQKGISDDRILSQLSYYSAKSAAQGKPLLNAKSLAKKFNFDTVGNAIARGQGKSAAPEWLRLMGQPAQSEFNTERDFLKKRLKDRGIALTDGQLKNALQLQASHVQPRLDAAGAKIWTELDNLIPDLGYVNGYVNDLSGKNNRFMKILLEQSKTRPGDLAKKGIDLGALERISKGIHPVTEKEISTLRAISREHMKFMGPNNPSFYRAMMVDEGLAFRQKNGYYKKPVPTYAQRVAANQFKASKKAPISQKSSAAVNVRTPKPSSSQLGRTPRTRAPRSRAEAVAFSMKNILGYKNGVVSVPGPKGKGDVVPAMLSPGEAVIPTKMAEKYAPLISGMISDAIPGYKKGRGAQKGFRFGSSYSGTQGLPTVPPTQASKAIAESMDKAFSGTPVKRSFSRLASSLTGVISGGIREAKIGAMMAKESVDQYKERFKQDLADSKTYEAKRSDDRQVMAGSRSAEREAAREARVARREAAKKNRQSSRLQKQYAMAGVPVNAAGRPIDPETGRFISKDAAGQKVSSAKAARRAKISGRVGGAAGAAGTAAMMYGMSGGPGADIAGMAAMPLMLAPMLGPMLKTPVGIAVAAFAALGVTVWALNEQFKKNTKEAFTLEMSTGATSENLRKLAEFSGNVSAGEIMDKRRDAGVDVFQTKAGKTGFGETFLQSDAGKEMYDTFANVASTQGRDVAKDKLTSQLTSAVASGALEAGQARDIVAAIGKEMNDFSFSIDVNSRLLSVLGPNGENLIDDPLSVRLSVVKESQQEVAKFGEMFSKQTGLALKTGMLQGDLVGVSAAAGMAIGGMIGTMVLPGIGTAIGAVVGGAATGIASYFLTKDEFEDSAESIGGFVASSAIALQNQQEMNDSLQIEYERRIANAKAQGNIAEATKLEKEFAEARNKLMMENAGTMATIQEAFAQSTQQTTILESYKTMTEDMYKDDTLMTGVLKSIEKDLEALDNETEVVLRASLLSGDLTPTTLQAMMASEDFDKQVNLLVNLGAAGATQANQIAQLFGNKTVDVFSTNVDDARAGKKTAVSASGQFIEALGKKSPADAAAMMESFDPIIQTLSAAGTEALAVGMTFYLENPEKLEEVNEEVDAFKKKIGDKPVTLEIIQEVYGQDMVDQIATNQAYFDSLPDDQKLIYTTVLRVLGEMTPAAREALAVSEALSGTGATAFQRESGGLSFGDASRFIGPNSARIIADRALTTSYAVTVTETGATQPNTQNNNNNNTSSGGNSSDPFEGILRRLKEVRNASIDASGGMKELMRVLSGKKNIRVFAGMEQGLVKFGSAFSEYVLGLDEKTRKTFVKFDKNGRATLTAVGKAAQKAFAEIAIGDMQISLSRGLEVFKNQEAALNILVSRGMSYADAMAIASDETIALAIANGQLTGQELTNLVNLAEDYNDQLRLTNALEAARRDIQAAEDQAKIFKFTAFQRGRISKAQTALQTGKFADGRVLTAAERTDLTNYIARTNLEIEAFLSDNTLQELYLAGGEMADEFAQRLDQIIGSKEFVYGMVDKATAAVDEWFANREQRIGLDFELGTNNSGQNTGLINMSALRREVEDAQEYIAERMFKVDDYEYSLDQISKQEEVINKKYDDRIEALDKIDEINSQINDRQKAQMDIAAALSSGDMAAAARAAQAAREKNAEIASQKAREAIEKQRERELKAITSNGMTRVQIEKEINTLLDEIAKKEEDILEPKQRALDLAQQALDKSIQALEYEGLQRSEWEQIGNRIKISREELEKYAAILAGLQSGSNTGGLTITDNPPVPPAQPPAEVTPPEEKKTALSDGRQIMTHGGRRYVRATRGESIANLTKILKTTFGSTIPALTTANVANLRPENKNGSYLYNNQWVWLPTGFSQGGMVPQYKRLGGMIQYKKDGGIIPYKAMGTDTVPAMLTPGEFVVKKYAVDSFGVDNLKAINNGTFKGDSMYNYEVNVNVKSDANPDQIARAVMGQIKQIDSQRIRGNRF